MKRHNVVFASPWILALGLTNLILLNVLLYSWKDSVYITRKEPETNDANGNDLDIQEVVLLKNWFGNTLYRIKLIVANSLAIDAIVFTELMNRHVE